MWLLVVLLIILLGYRINSQVDEKVFKLKRSSGWVSYAILGADGAVTIGIAFSLIAAIYISMLLNGSNLGFPYLDFGKFEEHITKLLNDSYLQFIFSLMLLVLSGIINEIRLNLLNAEPDLSSLKKLDGLVNIVLTALENSSYLKISLSSGKVYVGVLLKEDFVKGDSETLTVLPMLSGYRDKENSQIILNCDYSNVYLKHRIIEKIPEGICYNEDKADFATLLIPVSEIESIAFFDINMYEDFKYEDNAAIQFKELQQPDSYLIDDIRYSQKKAPLINR